MRNASSNCEHCWILVGTRRGNVWKLRKVRRTVGTRVEVDFDALWVLRREEETGDVFGFFHTHPDGSMVPSSRDERTMRAWVSALGKPLWCLIHGSLGVGAWLYDDEGRRGGGVDRLTRGTLRCRPVTDQEVRRIFKVASKAFPQVGLSFP
jgi:proteasome lid subunit RPN8/RPN11